MLKCPDFLPATLIVASHRVHLSAGQVLFACGAPVENLYWVLRGEVVAQRPMPSGQNAVMMCGRRGEFFAESSLYTPVYDSDAVARTPAVVMALPLPTLRQTLADDVHFSDVFLRLMVMALRRQSSRVERLRLRGASERIQHYLSCEASADGCCQLDMPLSEWALELGLEPETLYRTLRVLEEKGLVSRDKQRMRLCTGTRPHILWWAT